MIDYVKFWGQYSSGKPEFHRVRRPVHNLHKLIIWAQLERLMRLVCRRRVEGLSPRPHYPITWYAANRRPFNSFRAHSLSCYCYWIIVLHTLHLFFDASLYWLAFKCALVVSARICLSMCVCSAPRNNHKNNIALCKTICHLCACRRTSKRTSERIICVTCAVWHGAGTRQLHVYVCTFSLCLTRWWREKRLRKELTAYIRSYFVCSSALVGACCGCKKLHAQKR